VTILYFSQYFPPEIGAAPKRAYLHARNWVEMGHRVTVVTNVPHSPLGRFYPGYKNRLLQKETMDGIHVLRMWTFPAGKKSQVIIRFLSSFFYLTAALFTVFMKKPDIILGSAPFFAGFAAYLTSRLRRVPLVYEMRDPWIQMLQAGRKKSGRLLKLLSRWERHIARKTDLLTVIGDRMSAYVAGVYGLTDAPRVIRNGIDDTQLSQRDPYKPGPLPATVTLNSQRLNVGFLGNLGSQYDLDVVVEAALLLKEQGDDVDFLFVGEGMWKKHLACRVAELGLDNVRLFDLVSEEASMDLLSRFDLSIVPLRKGEVYDMYLPLKLYESLAMAVPPLLSNGSDAARLIEQAGCGACFDNAEPRQLVDLIRDYAAHRTKILEQGQKGRAFALEHCTRRYWARQYLLLFAPLIGTVSADTANDDLVDDKRETKKK